MDRDARALDTRETKQEWWARREEFFATLDKDELVHALLMVQWREKQRFRRNRAVPRAVLEAARQLVAMSESPTAERLNNAVADMPELMVQGIKGKARDLFRNVALTIGEFNLTPEEQMMLVSIILHRDDDDGGDREEAEPDRPRTPATVE